MQILVLLGTEIYPLQKTIVEKIIKEITEENY